MRRSLTGGAETQRRRDDKENKQIAKNRARGVRCGAGAIGW